MRKLTPFILALSLVTGISAVHAQNTTQHKKPLLQEGKMPEKPAAKQGQSVQGQKQKAPKFEIRKGGRLASPERHAELRDYRKRGLKAPRKDQRWVLYDGQYLLIAPKTGLILSIVPARR